MKPLRSHAIRVCRACGYPRTRRKPCGNCGDENHGVRPGTPNGIVTNPDQPHEAGGCFVSRKGKR